jgi:hypothetical protein
MHATLRTAWAVLLTVALAAPPARALQAGDYVAGAPSGTGLEWMTIAAVIVPALVLVALVYAGRQRTV